VKPVVLSIVTLFFAGLLQALLSSGQTVNPTAQEPLKIDAVSGVRNLLNKPDLTYPKDALQQHIEGKVELELTVSPQGDVVSERVISGPLALQQATTDAFKKVKYIPFLRNLESSVALVRVIIAYEKERATISTESEHAPAVNRDDFDLGTGGHGRPMGNVEILSDTRGVDFSAYLQGVLHNVRQNWYNAIPESAQRKHGNVIIEFAITKVGKVEGMKLVTGSGDIPLDRAAWASIAGSDPFPALPSDFGGQYLALRLRFFYNPTKEELAPANPTTSSPVIK
jgi:TonB family protein